MLSVRSNTNCGLAWLWRLNVRAAKRKRAASPAALVCSVGDNWQRDYTILHLDSVWHMSRNT